MPPTVEEEVAFVHALLDERIMPDTRPLWADGTHATDDDMKRIIGLVIYEAHLRAKTRSMGARRKANRLLRRFLTEEQQRQLKRREFFIVTTASGRHYRLYPGSARVEEVTRHGSRFFVLRSFCIHPEETLPSADVTLAQLLLLTADEEAFLTEANARDRCDQLWNGEYMRRIRQATREREEQAA